MPIKKLALLVITLTVHIVLVIYTKDLQQVNNENLFLSQSGQKSYQDFLEQIPGKKLLVVKVNNDSSMIGSNIKKIQDLCPECDITSMPEKIREHQPKSLRLVGENYRAFLVGFPHERSSLDNQKIVKEIETLNWGKGHAEMGGLPRVNYLLNQYSDDIKKIVFPTLFIIAFLFTWFFTASFSTAIFLFIPALFSVFETLSLVKVVFIHMNMITSIVPLLVFVINLSLMYHLYFSLQTMGDIKDVVKEKYVPVLLMLVTTGVGFGSLGLSEIEVIRQFALLSVISLIITTMITFFHFYLFSPILVIKKDFSHLTKIFSRELFYRTMNEKGIWSICGMVIIVACFAAPKIPVLTNANKYFPADSKDYETLKNIEDQVVGNPNFELLIKNENDGDWSLEQLARIDDVERTVQLASKDKFKVISLNQMIRSANSSYSGNSTLPKEKISYFTLKGKLPLGFQESFMTDDVYRMVVTGNSKNSDEYEKDLVELKKILSIYSWLKYEINGLYFNILKGQSSLISILAKSFLLSLGIIAFITFCFYRNVKVLVLFLICNIIPSGLALIFMYALGFNLNVATVMIFSIVLGMIVDSSLHLTHHFLKKDSFEYIYSSTILPIVTSGCLLIISFLTFGLNGFLPIRQFGVGLGIGLFFGLFFDLYVLPTLLTGKTRLNDDEMKMFELPKKN